VTGSGGARRSPKPEFFPTPDALREWLRAHHDSADELLVGLHKRDSGRPSITWPELVDELLCFGWIDGVRRSIDDSSYSIRISPRRKRSLWSAVNLKRVEELIAAGRMEPAGLAAYEARDESRQRAYSYEREQVLAPELESRFRANAKAWTFFESQSPWYRRTATHWVMSAKREGTREKRFRTLLDDSANGLRIEALRR
jgi:uncharacterized protein YdeI (YjbR/CyaY-like superfamily)